MAEEIGNGQAGLPIFWDMDGIVNVIEQDFDAVAAEISRLCDKRDKICDEITRLQKRLQEVGKARSQARKMAEFLGSIKHFREAIEIDKKAKIGPCLVLPSRKMDTN